MKAKSLITLTVLALFGGYIASCAGYFGAEGNGGSPAEARALAIAGGAYLSSDTYNEVTPFLYRDTNGQNPVLFYSSDKDGTYDIYYARMNPDGTFQAPVKMGTNVNTDTADELFPVVYDYTWTTNRYLHFLRTNISVVQRIDMTNSLSDKNFIFGLYTNTNYATSIKGLGLKYSDDGSSLSQNYYVFDGTTNMYENGVWPNKTPGAVKSFSGSGLKDSKGGDAHYISEFWLLEKENNNFRQLFLYNYAEDSWSSITFISNQGIPASYASIYNDRQPCVDWWDPEQNGRVYFSSDRAGTYDLYRYNIETISKIVEYYPFAEWLTNKGYL